MSWPYLAAKYLSTAAVIVLVSELAKRSDRLGALVASLPLVTLMVLIWLHLEHQAPERITSHAWYTFWYVLPTLPPFLLFPRLYQNLGFCLALGAFILLILGCFLIFAVVLRSFGLELL